MIWFWIGCNYRTFAKRGTDLSNNTPKRWRDLAAQVVPPMMERKTMIVMVDTLSILYYEKMVGYAPSKLCGFGLRQ